MNPRSIPQLEARLAPRQRPARSPVGYQRWNELLFLHWDFEPATVQASLPPGLYVDTFEGRAYVGVVPFFMEPLVGKRNLVQEDRNMLVIGREVGEVIMIGENIRLVVVETRDGVVRFGVDAPREVPVHRSEVYKRIKEAKKAEAG